MRIIDASNNYIEEVNLSLPKLESLNLMNNYLKKFPKLKNMKKLKVLDLTSNKITDFKNVMAGATPNIERLELSRNDLQFETEQEFSHFIQILRQFTKLKTFQIQGNPFLKIERLKQIRQINVKEKFLKNLSSLERFNGEDVSKIRLQDEDADGLSSSLNEDEQSQLSQTTSKFENGE